jgi:hypothetical protein
MVQASPPSPMPSQVFLPKFTTTIPISISTVLVPEWMHWRPRYHPKGGDKIDA